MKTLFFLLLTLIFCSCKTELTEDVTIQKEISYFKDKRTNLCFAYIYSTSYRGYEVVSITYVPCENVKHLIK